jgi:hypothetical protein
VSARQGGFDKPYGLQAMPPAYVNRIDGIDEAWLIFPTFLQIVTYQLDKQSYPSKVKTLAVLTPIGPS